MPNRVNANNTHRKSGIAHEKNTRIRRARDGTGEVADGRLSDQLVGLSHRGHSGKAEKAVCRDDRADARS